MGYYIQAIIGAKSLLEGYSADFESAVVTELASGFALIPITNDLLDVIGASGDSGRFYKFTPAFAEWLRAISASGAVAYVEAEFFGGVGGQGATVWSHGAQLLAPTHQAQAINTALRVLGVSRSAFFDEFDAVGLGRHRDTNDWLDDANL